MKRIALLLVLVVGLAATSAARSQQPATKGSAKAAPAHDSVDLKLSPDLQKSLDSLALAVQSLAVRIANDPQIKSAAMQVASGFVSTAQQVVAEQSVAIEDALKTAAERIAAAQSSQRQRAKKP